MTCQKCSKRSTCVKPCEEINKILKDNGIYSADYIRPEMYKKRRDDGRGKYREKGVDILDDVASERAIYLKFGRKKIEKYPETS